MGDAGSARTVDRGAIAVLAAVHPGTLAKQGTRGEPPSGLGGATPPPRPIPEAVDERLGWLKTLNALTLISAGFLLVILWFADVIRPGSLERHGKRDVGGHPWPIWLFAGVMLYLIWVAVATLISSTPWIAGGAAGTGSLRHDAVVAAGSYAGAAVAGALLVYMMAGRGGAAGAGLSVRAADGPIGLGCLALAFPIVQGVSMASVWVTERATGSRPDPIAHGSLTTLLEHRHEPAAWLLGGAAVFGAPIVEELIHRAFVQSAILRALKGSHHWAAIGLSSALFTAAHHGSVPGYAMPGLFVLSVALGLAYERTGRLGVPIAMHMAFNAANVAMAVYAG